MHTIVSVDTALRISLAKYECEVCWSGRLLTTGGQAGEVRNRGPAARRPSRQESTGFLNLVQVIAQSFASIIHELSYAFIGIWCPAQHRLVR